MNAIFPRKVHCEPNQQRESRNPLGKRRAPQVKVGKSTSQRSQYRIIGSK